MFNIVLAIAFFIAAWFARAPIEEKTNKTVSKLAAAGLASLGLFFLLLTSWINPPADHVAHLKRVYFAESMTGGQVIAMEGQAGRQAEVKMSGFKFIPLIRVLNDIEYAPFVTIPKGHVGVLNAVDGKPLRNGQAIADEWKSFTTEDGEKHNAMDMLDAVNFLTHGGQKGEQYTVLPPGKWPVNTYLFEVTIVKATSIKAGTVGVVTSRYSAPNAKCPSQADLLKYEGANKKVAAPLVPEGCIGVREDPLLNGYHYVNPNAIKTDVVPTRVTTWKYKGCFTKREVVLEANQDGTITQKIPETSANMPKDAADCAIEANVEGWKVPTEFSLLVQVPPANASMMVASVGTLDDVENKIGTRALRSSYRDIVGGERIIVEMVCPEGKKACKEEDKLEKVTKRPWQILELVSARADIEEAIEAALAPELARAGVVLKEVQMGYAELPTGLLATRQREQLADQQRKTFIEEEKAQVQRQSLKAAEELANMQNKIVAAREAEKIAQDKAKAAEAIGEGERRKLEHIAKGERARAIALGTKAAERLAINQQNLEAAIKIAEIAAANPEMVKVSAVSSSGGGDSGSAAVLGSILGNSTVAAQIKQTVENN